MRSFFRFRLKGKLKFRDWEISVPLGAANILQELTPVWFALPVFLRSGLISALNLFSFSVDYELNLSRVFVISVKLVIKIKFDHVNNFIIFMTKGSII